MPIPCYPDFTPLDIELKNYLHPGLSLTEDGVSEFTFSLLYLFRDRYKYRISMDRCGSRTNGCLIISGVQPAAPEKTFFMTPCGAPGQDVLEHLFKTHHYWKNISHSVLFSVQEKMEKCGIKFAPDRDNFDYIYLRKDPRCLI